MQRIPFAEGWAIAQEPGLPVPIDEDDEIIFEEAPASPDPSSTATSVYEITASNVISESSSVPTSGLPTPPPTDGPPLPIDELIRKAAQRLQEAAPAAAPEAAPEAAPKATPEAAPEATPEAAPEAAHDAAPEAALDAGPTAAHAAAATPPPSPLRRSARLAERARVGEEAAARACPRRGPQRVAKMSTGGVRKN